jgi:hypothetical protein
LRSSPTLIVAIVSDFSKRRSAWTPDVLQDTWSVSVLITTEKNEELTQENQVTFKTHTKPVCYI